VGTATEGYQGTVATSTYHPVIVDVATGKILASLAEPSLKGRGIDGVAYDSGAKRYFLADQSPTYGEAGSIWVYDATQVKPAMGDPLSTIGVGDAHMLTVDDASHDVFVPVNLKGLVVYVLGGY
jgi:hypothetical protein